jgi:hypothetical protein
VEVFGEWGVDQIDIWEDAWFTTSPTRKVYTPKEGILQSKLSDLINPITRSWYEKLIRENF